METLNGLSHDMGRSVADDVEFLFLLDLAHMTVVVNNLHVFQLLYKVQKIKPL
jgi:hypothetical protein